MRCAEPKEELLEAFRVHDPNGSGWITEDQVRMVLAALDENLTEEEIDEGVSESSKDEDGRINIEDFVNILMAY